MFETITFPSRAVRFCTRHSVGNWSLLGYSNILYNCFTYQASTRHVWAHLTTLWARKCKHYKRIQQVSLQAAAPKHRGRGCCFSLNYLTDPQHVQKCSVLFHRHFSAVRLSLLFSCLTLNFLANFSVSFLIISNSFCALHHRAYHSPAMCVSSRCKVCLHAHHVILCVQFWLRLFIKLWKTISQPTCSAATGIIIKKKCNLHLWFLSPCDDFQLDQHFLKANVVNVSLRCSGATKFRPTPCLHRKT